VRSFLLENRELASEIEGKLRALLLVRPVRAAAAAADEELEAEA
jgi:hypothetical protein